jgi:hypothetical protein
MTYSLDQTAASTSTSNDLIGRVARCRIAVINLPVTTAAVIGWRSETTAHGFRSVLNTWATEETDHSQIVVDLALAHEIESRVEKAYRRGLLEDKRLAVLKDWETYLGSYQPPAQG